MPTLSAGNAHLSYGPAGFHLQITDTRLAPIQIGEVSITAVYDLGRFQLTPAAAKNLEKSLAEALRTFKAIHGVDLTDSEEMAKRDMGRFIDRDMPAFPTDEPNAE